MEAKQPCVYMLASGRHGTLYIGVTSNLLARVQQHRGGVIPGFTKRYAIKRLVWFEWLTPWKPPSAAKSS